MTPKETKRPALLLFGKRRATAAVAQALDRLRIAPWWAPWTEDAPDLMDEDTVGVVLVAPLRVPIREALAELRSRPQHFELPLFAVVPDGTTVAQVRAAYRAGATAVLEWPRERAVFARLLVERLALDAVRGPLTHPDKALGRTIRAHLRLAPFVPGRLRVQVSNGVASISGQVDHLWQRDEIEDRVTQVPGVRGVITGNVHVLPSDQPDARIKRNIRRLLRDTADLDDDTLLVQVQRGFVDLSGTVSNRGELNRCLRLIAHVDGVRGIVPKVRVSAAQKQRDHLVAKRLRKILSYLYSGTPVSVSFFEGVAVLSGTVSRLSQKREIEGLVADDNAVERVVNKIEVVEKP